MTDTTALADRIVALLGGKTTTYNPWPPAHAQTVYLIGEKLMGYMPADEFVRDGRVILALMEKCDSFTIDTINDNHGVFVTGVVAYANLNETPGRASHAEKSIAIATACCEALENE